ncbi:MAG: c-type cytochrome [Gammaproteobacteria bacterium]
MRLRSCATFIFSLIFFSLPEAYAADPIEGRDFFITRCLGCHAFACNREGPRLGGLFGRKVATAEGYKFYSQGLKDSDIVWTAKTLDNFFSDPGKIFPESEMAVQGEIKNPAQRQKLIAFLKTEDPTVNLCPQE